MLMFVCVSVCSRRKALVSQSQDERSTNKMANWARSDFTTLKSKRQRTEDDDDDFNFVNKRFQKKVI